MMGCWAEYSVWWIVGRNCIM